MRILPNMREGRVLQKLLNGRYETIARLRPAGPGTIASLIDRRWIERMATTGMGADYVRITQAGRAAFEALTPLTETHPGGRRNEPEP